MLEFKTIGKSGNEQNTQIVRKVIVYIRNEELRDIFTKYMRMIVEIEEKHGIMWKNEHMRWIYIKIVIQLEYIREISNESFDDERERKEY